MLKVIILGIGNVGFNLATEILNTASAQLIQVYNRSLKPLEYFKEKIAITNDLTKLKQADIYIICTSDKAIEKISNNLPKTNAVIVHTSGSTNINTLDKHKNYGVFYPLQTFSKHQKVNFKQIPICIEANSNKTLSTLKRLAESISDKIYNINSQQRFEVHKAAVFVNNFVNHLYYIGEQICENNDIDAEILHPLIQETVKKVETMSAYDAQTGPARRGDSKTIENHLSDLAANHKEIYKLLSQSIAKTYGKKL